MNSSNNTNPKQPFTWLRSLTINNLILAFLLVQIYFISNLLSFGLWKTGIALFVYAITYFGVIILALTIILLLYLKIANYGKLPRTTLSVLVVLALPMFGIWVQTLDFQNPERWIEYILLLMFPFVIVAYFRFFALRRNQTSMVLVGLCVISFMSHAPFIWPSQDSESVNPNMKFASISLSHKPNIHVVMFDSLTTSWYSKEFLNTENPAADYLSNLNDSIFAGKNGVFRKCSHKGSLGNIVWFRKQYTCK